jgi:hypothetical protein
VCLGTLLCGNIVLFTAKVSDVAIFTTLYPLSLLVPCKLLFQVVSFKVSSLRILY